MHSGTSSKIVKEEAVAKNVYRVENVRSTENPITDAGHFMSITTVTAFRSQKVDDITLSVTQCEGIFDKP